ncbi:MAG: aldo/keto reductase [Terriglobia bacterium]|jgi:aryl-alcohol dehydrogenase-like predicted oxidoreductase
MRYQLLGRTGLKVSVLCLGTMTFGSSPSPSTLPGSSEKESLMVLDRFLDAGGNFIDTADGYAEGRSEEILGKGIKGRRHQIVLATKVFSLTGKGPNQKGLSRKHIAEAVENSLRRLDTDYIDLYQAHCFDSRTPLEETLEALDQLVRQGKVLYLGCSNFAGWQLAKALGISRARGLSKFECLQPQYSLVCRSIERELLPLCREEGVGVIPWSPLAGGFLSGKYRPGGARPSGSRLAESDPASRGSIERFLTERNFRILGVVEAVARELGKSASQVALAWLLAAREVTAVIFGARTISQLEENLSAIGWDFPRELWLRLDQASALPMEYPQDVQNALEPLIHGDVDPRP